MAVEVVQAGVDTWSPCWYLHGCSEARAALDAVVDRRRGGLLSQVVDGHRVGWMSDLALLWAEGKAAGEAVLPPTDLELRYWALVRALQESGVPLPGGLARREFAHPGMPGLDEQAGAGGLRRLDLTVDVSFADPVEGRAFLAGVAALGRVLPGRQAEVRCATDGSGAIETVYVRGRAGKKVLARCYDKGVQSGLAGRGELVRLEDQRRWPRELRRSVEELQPTYLRGLWHRRWLHLWRASNGVIVAGPAVLADRLADLVVAGEVTQAEAERLAGFLLLQSRGVAHSRATVYRRRQRLRELGVLLGDGVLEEVEVDVHQVMERALDSPVWGSQG